MLLSSDYTVFNPVTVSCLERDVRLLPDISNSSNYNARLRSGDMDLPSYSFYKDELRLGRVELCQDGAYTAVCNQNWDNKDASVVCSQLGFSPNGKCSSLVVIVVFISKHL